MKLVAVSAGLSVPSTTRMLTDRLVEATVAAVRARGEEVETQVIELRSLALDVARVMVTGMPEDSVETALDALEAADAVIAVSPIFAGSYSGVFKSFFDLVGTERLSGKPVLVAATGGSIRHSLALDHALRPLFVAMRANIMPTGVFAATDDFGASGLQQRVERAGAELAATLAGAQTQLTARHLVEEPVAEEVNPYGKGASTTLLRSDGTKGRLRPDLEDFTPMTEIFKQLL